MSVRYTAEATMDEPALRDVERWKDKIEVRLDNRQVFFLFFGSALVACMLFVLGVIVGKRIESRGRADAPEIQDPLAVLDRVNQPASTASAAATDQGLAFPKALIGTAGARSKPLGLSPRPLPAPVVPPVPAPAARTTLASTAPAPPVPVSPAPPARAPVDGAPRAPLPPAPPRPLNAAAAKPSPAVGTKPVAVGAVGAKPGVPQPQPQPQPAAGPTPTAKAPGAAPKPIVATDPALRGKFTLQLSSFPDRGEADAFARRFATLGAFVITSEIPGKGVWYRVRLGNYGSVQEATTAKANFEKQHNVIAYVAAR